ncbi:MAG TPA: gliding motility-associated C-terminal domain-containing protein, partial [Flavobacteriales bacterium]|nr:gliding motility-associated C-terminal domain-containing protein [Flavobacteriales bacterium]
FSPDGNGENDLHCILGAECLREISFTIYDRWGTKVFETTNPATCWDGTLSGKAMNPGVFVYHLSGTRMDGEAINKQGNITLMR